ncbi:hypothetical protein EC991_000196 [Linnemannia zychae]|nr:hypothetical protein EC991_000196 [Linnemannia zychae]
MPATAVAAVVDKPTKTTMGFDIVVSFIEDQSDQESGSGASTPNRRYSRPMASTTTNASTAVVLPIGGVDQLQMEQRFSGRGGAGSSADVEGAGVAAKTGRIRSNAIAQQQQLSQEKYSYEQEHQQPKTPIIQGNSTSGVVVEEASLSTNMGLDKDSTSTTAAVIQPGEGPRWSNNYKLASTTATRRARSSSTPLLAPEIVAGAPTNTTTKTQVDPSYAIRKPSLAAPLLVNILVFATSVDIHL